MFLNWYHINVKELLNLLHMLSSSLYQCHVMPIPTSYAVQFTCYRISNCIMRLVNPAVKQYHAVDLSSCLIRESRFHIHRIINTVIDL